MMHFGKTEVGFLLCVVSFSKEKREIQQIPQKLCISTPPPIPFQFPHLTDACAECRLVKAFTTTPCVLYSVPVRDAFLRVCALGLCVLAKAL